MPEIFSKIFSKAYLDALGLWLMTSGVRIILIIFVAFIVIKLFSIITRRLEKLLIKDSGDFISALETEKRIKTLDNIVRKASTIAICSIAVMMILREVGMDIAPLIAGAGIVGLAVGFGAQNLVRDVISGFFFIMENQVRIGDVATINGTGGLVQEINIRTIVLRDIEGTVHVFPNGTIQTLSNRSKGWARYVVDVGVAYKENVDDVMQVLREIGEGMSKDEKFGPMILEPLEVLGVDNFGPSEVVIKCMVKTLPLKQWEVGRELRRRIKNTFDEKGIEIPFPHVSVYSGEATKPFAVSVNEIEGKHGINGEKGFELIKKIAEKRGQSVEEVMNELLDKVSGNQRSN